MPPNQQPRGHCFAERPGERIRRRKTHTMNTQLDIVKSESPAGFAPLCGSEAVKLASRLKVGMKLDRAQTNRLLKTLENLESEVAGCAIMQAQLRDVLARKDWLVISITANAATVREFGVNIGIVQAKTVKTKTRLSPMQKWQKRNGLDRRSL